MLYRRDYTEGTFSTCTPNCSGPFRPFGLNRRPWGRPHWAPHCVLLRYCWEPAVLWMADPGSVHAQK